MPHSVADQGTESHTGQVEDSLRHDKSDWKEKIGSRNERKHHQRESEQHHLSALAVSSHAIHGEASECSQCDYCEEVERVKQRVDERYSAVAPVGTEREGVQKQVRVDEAEVEPAELPVGGLKRQGRVDCAV